MGDVKAVKDGGGVYPTACNNVIGVVGVVAFGTNVTAEVVRLVSKSRCDR